ncbi:uridine kinase family protein [Actinoplanes sp. CA-015351]|uniref:uridine kinase family protein n=1 Tax=Actinoplanes sp. CA-015351 TaxID=3239897 RepID=UPI003D964EEF
MKLGPDEPLAGPWQELTPIDFAASVQAAAGSPAGRPRLIAVDGRSGSGKSTLAGRLRELTPGSAVVHTDDVAWWHSRFGWAPLMISGVLDPLHAGLGVRFRPPAWEQRGREGFIEVPAGCSAVFVEGVGASRRELLPLLDAAIWVQSDFAEAERRGILRDVDRDGLDPGTAKREWDEWMAEEIPFLRADRPWERAGFVVRGTGDGTPGTLTTSKRA